MAEARSAEKVGALEEVREHSTRSRPWTLASARRPTYVHGVPGTFWAITYTVVE